MYQQLPNDLQHRLMSEIKAGESVVWTGQPNPTKMMLSGFIMWLFFIPWTAFALFWTAGASGFRLPDLSRGIVGLAFPLFGLPFVLIGLGGLSAPFFMRAKARKTLYAVTNRRALKIEGGRKTSIVSYYPEHFCPIERKESADGSGDIMFIKENYRDSDGDRRKKESGFHAVPNVKAAHEHLERLLANCKEKAVRAPQEMDFDNIYQ